MSDIQKQIENINKQNEGMEIAFKNKGIAFTKLSIDSMDSETELTLLQNYNAYLKNISKNNRPAPQQKDIKVSKQEKPQPSKKSKQNDSEDED